jgi:hypothetical protein
LNRLGHWLVHLNAALATWVLNCPPQDMAALAGATKK